MNSKNQNKIEYSEQIIENLRQSYCKGNDIIVDDCSMAETAIAYACGDLSSEQTHEIVKHINACKFCTDLVLDTRLAEWDARELGGQAPEVLPSLSKAIHKPVVQSSILSFLKHLPILISNFCSFLLSPKVMATLATASLAFIIINYGLNDSEIIKKSVMLPKKARPQKKVVQRTIKPSVSSPDKQKDIHTRSPDTYKNNDPKEYINSVKPLYEGKPDVSKLRRMRRSRNPRTPLERIDISQLKLVGIVVSNDGNKALLESTSGKGYVVQEGAYIGTNAGKIVQIQKDKIVIAEQVEDVMGKMNIRKIELKLYSKKQDINSLLK
ncbi:MAG: pilus assembly protein PilP [Desulfobacteraceae bacterium]|jgi:type IV pilus assembly protein PilP